MTPFETFFFLLGAFYFGWLLGGLIVRAAFAITDRRSR